ncbi:hypothetical protein Y032_0009g391 [Ancylostoma ceylanicum]|uniref:SXP/RAL-2 family protein Ani s 5-like cation-binding domain-containing protein n=1 Tax=Ancylostoma ceylanicum TaxID=53326 RepID=A0A016VHF0_9BILA|nr:hypothetical protein Y032_0009g391 [Ancylostoma ceylanicum]
MRSLHIIFIILVVHHRGSSADLLGWAKETWRFTADGTGKTWNDMKAAAGKLWNAVKTGNEKAWQYVESKRAELTETVKSKLNDTVAQWREYAEDDWDCGADKFWLSKLYTKLLTSAACLELKGE